MILYHGTGETAFQNIFSSGKLAATDVSLTYPDRLPMATEAGYLYLTNRLDIAIDYASLNEAHEMKVKRKAYVFKINLDHNSVPLEADIQDLRQFYKLYDDNKQYTFQESLVKCGSIRTPQDLYFGKEVVEYFEFYTGPSKPDNELSTKARKQVREFPHDPDFNPSQFKWIKT